MAIYKLFVKRRMTVDYRDTFVKDMDDHDNSLFFVWNLFGGKQLKSFETFLVNS